jgi:hypothetical protein
MDQSSARCDLQILKLNPRRSTLLFFLKEKTKFIRSKKKAPSMLGPSTVSSTSVPPLSHLQRRPAEGAAVHTQTPTQSKSNVEEREGDRRDCKRRAEHELQGRRGHLALTGELAPN